ncbi:hypothetical protein GCM10022408_12610 [Hymenobacter fastidiosus]|uniref:Lipocalin-like domain-containing protein n=1 Tax=Hymenobacter fastidiosus TaxID=486264 RepID=A0ABP7RV25_9BACT
MKRFTLSALLLTTMASSLVFTSCKKDKEEPKPKTRTELLTARNWRISAATYTVGPDIEDVYRSVPGCTKDDFTKFNTDKTTVFDEGPTRCSTSDPQSSKGAWDLTSGDNKLLIQESTTSTSGELYEIVELTESTLKIKQTDSSTPAETIAITFTAF